MYIQHYGGVEPTRFANVSSFNLVLLVHLIYFLLAGYAVSRKLITGGAAAAASRH